MVTITYLPTYLCDISKSSESSDSSDSSASIDISDSSDNNDSSDKKLVSQKNFFHIPPKKYVYIYVTSNFFHIFVLHKKTFFIK